MHCSTPPSAGWIWYVHRVHCHQGFSFCSLFIPKVCQKTYLVLHLVNGTEILLLESPHLQLITLQILEVSDVTPFLTSRTQFSQIGEEQAHYKGSVSVVGFPVLI